MDVKIVIMLKNGQQIEVGVDEVTAPKTVSKMRADIWGDNAKESFCVQDYVESKDPNELMVVDNSMVSIITIARQSNIAVPQKKNILVGPGRPGA